MTIFFCKRKNAKIRGQTLSFQIIKLTFFQLSTVIHKIAIQFFFEALYKSMFMLNKTKKKCLVLEDINLNPENVKPASCDYIRLLQSNAFFSLVTSPTRVTSTSQTSIDCIFTNDYESIVTPGVLTYWLSDHFPIFCTITNSQLQTPKAMRCFEFRNISQLIKKVSVKI